MKGLILMQVPFSPPDISEEEIEAVAKAMRSGWITTGPATKAFEKDIAEFCGTPRAVAMNSATACMELALRALDIGPGDEVITSAYTYTASCSVITHVGATPVLVDTAPGSFQMDPEGIARALTPRTKAIIPVDLGGVPCDYDTIERVLAEHAELWSPAPGFQEAFDRVVILADAAHSLGAEYMGTPIGRVADLTAFSLHAVKNVTTAEGGMLTWRAREGLDDDELYERFMLLSLHGQSKDALAKTTPGNWEYDIVIPAYKCNMTDIAASMGRVQLKRYPDLLARRQEIVRKYEAGLDSSRYEIVSHLPNQNGASSCHLFLMRLVGKDEAFRNRFISELAVRGVSANVHYKPLPLFTAYRELGFDIADYPNALAQYQNQVTLPLHTVLTDEQVDYVIASVDEAYGASGE